MNYMLKVTLAGAAMILTATGAAATTYTEDFEAFPSSESNWFGANSNAQNYYGSGSLRGNNPDGLWVTSGSTTCGNGDLVCVRFTPAFGADLTSFALDVAGFTPTTLSFYDASGTVLSSTPVTLTFGALTDPGVYARYSVMSSTGIGGFSFSGAAPGNTSIDNLVAVSAIGAVPEPASWAMMIVGVGVAGGALRRRRSAKVSFA